MSQRGGGGDGRVERADERGGRRRGRQRGDILVSINNPKPVAMQTPSDVLPMYCLEHTDSIDIQKQKLVLKLQARTWLLVHYIHYIHSLRRGPRVASTVGSISSLSPSVYTTR